MRVLSVTCNHCGAPLEVPKKAKFVTCSFCSSRLAVHHSGNAVYTEVLESIEQKTAEIAEDVETIKHQNDLERLDREWMMGKQQFMVRGKHGEYRVPSTAGSVIGMVLAGGFGLFWMSMAA